MVKAKKAAGTAAQYEQFWPEAGLKEISAAGYRRSCKK